MDTKTEFCWLIETDVVGVGIEYLEDANYGGSPLFTPDPYKARRFYSKKSSDCVAGVLSTDHDLDLRSVEHGFDTTNLTQETLCVNETAKTLHVDIMPDEIYADEHDEIYHLQGEGRTKYIRADIVHDITRAHLKCLAQSTPAPIDAEVRELVDMQDSALSLKVRAENIKAPEDAEIKKLCERIGYGAVMDSAARQWYLIDPVGCHTTYHCYGVVKQVTETIRAALKNGG